MAIAVVRQSDSGQRANIATATSYTLTIGGAPSSGNLLILAVGVNGNVTFTAPTGWTQIEGMKTSASLESHIYYRVADGTEGTSIACGSTSIASHWIAWYTEYSGADTSSPVAGSNICQVGSSSGLGDGTAVNNLYNGSMHLIIPMVKDSGANVTIDAATRASNPGALTYVGSNTGGIFAVYHTNSASSDNLKLWMRPMQRILTGTDNSPSLFAEYYGSSANEGNSCSLVINPAASGRVAVVNASGAGTAAFVKKNSGTFTSAAGSFTTSFSPSTTVVGHLLVMCVILGPGNVASITDTLTTPANWFLYGGFPLDQLLMTDTNQAQRYYCFYRIATGTSDEAVTVTKTGTQALGSWALHSFSGPFAFSGAALEETMADCTGVLIPEGVNETTGADLASDNAVTHPTGNIATSGDAISLACIMRIQDPVTSWSDSFTGRVTSNTSGHLNTASKQTLVAGRSGAIATMAKNNTTPARINGGFIVGFKVQPAAAQSGGDGWGMAG